MVEKQWTERDGIPIQQCPECEWFPDDPYDVCCTNKEAHGDDSGPEFEEVLYVPKTLLDDAEKALQAITAMNLHEVERYARDVARAALPADGSEPKS